MFGRAQAKPGDPSDLSQSLKTELSRALHLQTPGNTTEQEDARQNRKQFGIKG